MLLQKRTWPTFILAIGSVLPGSGLQVFVQNCTQCTCMCFSYQESNTHITGQTGLKRERWWWWQFWWWWRWGGGGVSYVKALTALTASANICHFQRAWILDLMCLNWFSSAWHCLSVCPPPLTHSPFFSLHSYLPFLILYLFIHLISQGSLRSLGRLRWMYWWRKSSQWCCPLCDLLHDTMSPKWQTWQRIKCFKVSQAEIKTQQAPLGWWTGFVAGKGRHVATMTPGLWCTGPTHVTSCSWRGKKGKESLVYIVQLECIGGSKMSVFAALYLSFTAQLCKNDETLHWSFSFCYYFL